MPSETPKEKTLASNKKATHDYFIEDHYEAGIALRGSEIKSLRAGKAQLREAYVRHDGREVWLINAHISIYDPASRQNHDPVRPRKLLLHRKEMLKILEKVKLKGYTIVPLDIHLSKGRAKVEIALAKGKKNYDKRQTIAKRDSERDTAQAIGRRLKGHDD